MATYFEYKCKGCGYTKAANPKGKDMVMMGEVHNYLCPEVKKPPAFTCRRFPIFVNLKSNLYENTKMSSDIAEQILGGGFLHTDISEEFLAGILQRGSEDVDHVVDDEETVVVMLTHIYINRRVLLVMALNVELLLLGEQTRVDGG